MQTPISWFSIPVADFDRAVRFYETVMNCILNRQEMEGRRMGMFPGDMDAPGGAVCEAEYSNPPGPMGSIVFLDGGDDLSMPLSRVEKAGGSVLAPKTLIAADIGYFAIFRDSEGNHVGLYSKH